MRVYTFRIEFAQSMIVAANLKGRLLICYARWLTL